MTHLSVNLNRIALLRNSREIDLPNLLKFGKIAIESGAHGLTVHPRPDQRHVRPADVRELAAYLALHPEREFNIEGNPLSQGGVNFMEMVRLGRPAQATLVPDGDQQSTSDHGWNLAADGAALAPLIAELKALGCRVSLFMDPDPGSMAAARALGADRVELYTKPYVDAVGTAAFEPMLSRYRDTIQAARAVGLGVNAGHDLNLLNLPALLALGGIAEVSIGHALTADALEMGYHTAVRAYLHVCGHRHRESVAVQPEPALL